MEKETVTETVAQNEVVAEKELIVEKSTGKFGILFGYIRLLSRSIIVDYF